MAGYRFPGPLGQGLSTFIDRGTSALTFSPPPGVLPDPMDHARSWVRQQVRHGAVVLAHEVGELAYNAVMHELRALGRDIDAALDKLSRLPKSLRDQAAYDFFAAFFDHYLPKKFLRNYIWGNGKAIKLTVQEMADCNPVINLLESKPFTHRLQVLRAQAATSGLPVTYPFTLEMVAGARTNGTLGQFTVVIDPGSTLVVQPDGSWSAQGTMQFKDTWDFDPKSFEKGGRSGQGEVKTRFGSTFLPGTPFDITSESTPFKQTQDDLLVVWAGGTPVAELDKVSKSDVAISQPDR